MDGEPQPHVEDNYSGPNGPGGEVFSNSGGAQKLGGKEYEP